LSADNVSRLLPYAFCSNGMKLIVNCMGELIANNRLGCEVVAEGFEGPGLDPSNEGQDKE
jgi:hypothetical protein